jgi:hypothetical protein
MPDPRIVVRQERRFAFAGIIRTRLARFPTIAATGSRAPLA